MKYIISIILALVVSVSFAKLQSQEPTNNISNSINSFAIDMYKELSSLEGNTFFSPFSISSALAMTYAGARGNTALEMGRVMHFDSDQEQFHEQYKQYLEGVLNEKKGIQLTIANSLWAQKSYTFLDDFLNVTEENYGAPVHLVDFMNGAGREEARKTINKWVEDKTNDKIKELLQPADLDPLTRLVLTNAIYFLGNWEKPFDPKLTENNNFYVSTDKTVDVHLMKHKEDFKYYENEMVQYLELPYKGNEMSMVILLPKDTFGLAMLESILDIKEVTKWANEATIQKVNILFPRYKTTFKTSLNKALSDLGMKDAFSESADFSGMTGSDDLLISNVIHQAFIEVNETGTEAAAATAVVMRMKSAFIAEEKFFTANHPFIFMIKENENDGILFMGRMLDPTK